MSLSVIKLGCLDILCAIFYNPLDFSATKVEVVIKLFYVPFGINIFILVEVSGRAEVVVLSFTV